MRSKIDISDAICVSNKLVFC